MYIVSLYFSPSNLLLLDYPVKLILRIQPTQRYDGNVRDYDLTDKLLFEGLTQLVLPEVEFIFFLSKQRKKKIIKQDILCRYLLMDIWFILYHLHLFLADNMNSFIT